MSLSKMASLFSRTSSAIAPRRAAAARGFSASAAPAMRMVPRDTPELKRDAPPTQEEGVGIVDDPQLRKLRLASNTEVGALVDILRQRIERGYPTLFQTAGSKSSYAAVRIFHNANVRENRRFVVNLSKEEVCALQKNLGSDCRISFDSPIARGSTLDDLIDLSTAHPDRRPQADAPLPADPDAIKLDEPAETRKTLLQEKLAKIGASGAPDLGMKALCWRKNPQTFAFIPYRKLVEVQDRNVPDQKNTIIEHTFEPVTISEEEKPSSTSIVFPPRKELGKPGIIEASKHLRNNYLHHIENGGPAPVLVAAGADSVHRMVELMCMALAQLESEQKPIFAVLPKLQASPSQVSTNPTNPPPASPAQVSRSKVSTNDASSDRENVSMHFYLYKV